jgi:Uma2 family endonuclease
VFGNGVAVVYSVVMTETSPRYPAYGAAGDPAVRPAVGSDTLVRRLHTALDTYVTSRSLGRLCAGVEIVLDQRQHIILRPDLSFIVDGRESIVRDRVWGPPDMVLDATSPLSHPGQLQERIAWFSLYGVREYWLVQLQPKNIAVLELAHGAVRRRRLFDEFTPVTSPLLPEFGRCVGEFLV